MNLELLLILSCWIGNKQDACNSMGAAYFKYEKIDEMVDQVNDKIKTQYPNVLFTASLLSSVQQKKIGVPVYAGTYFGVEFPTGNESKITCGWSYGF